MNASDQCHQEWCGHQMKERNSIWRKHLDKWIGCPLLFLLGLFHRKRERKLLNEKAVLNIVLIKTAAIGDTIILSAMVDEIKQQYPKSRITLICSKNNLAMVQLLRGVDNIFTFWMERPFHSLRQLHTLGRFDLLLDFGPWPRINGVISWMIRADYKVGFKRVHTYRHYVYDQWVEHLDSLHEIDNYRNILKVGGIKISGRRPYFATFGDNVIKERPYVVFHQYPGGAMEFQRKWAEERWVELGKCLYQKYGTCILLSGAQLDQEEAEHSAQLMRRDGVAAKSIAGVYSLEQMAQILAGAVLVVSVNTGIMHLAAAVGAPLIALHGATSEKRWGPLSENAVVVKSGEPCQPCISLGFESKCTDPVCMQNITVDMVVCTAEQMLSSTKTAIG